LNPVTLVIEDPEKSATRFSSEVSAMTLPVTHSNNNDTICLMGTTHIVSLLIEERDRLQAAIQALRDTAAASPYDDPSMPDWVKPAVKKAPAPKKRRMSAAARKRIGEAARKRWSALRAGKAAPVAKAASSVAAKVSSAPHKAPAKKVAKRKAWTPAMKKAHTARMKAFWAAKAN
jgi:hypothetical protein